MDPLDSTPLWATTVALLPWTLKRYVSSPVGHLAPAVGTAFLQRVPGGPTELEVTAGRQATTTPLVVHATTTVHPVRPSAVHPAQDCTTLPLSHHRPVEHQPTVGRTKAAAQVAATTQNAVDTWLMGQQVTLVQDPAMAPPVTLFSTVPMYPCRVFTAAGPPSVAL